MFTSEMLCTVDIRLFGLIESNCCPDKQKKIPIIEYNKTKTKEMCNAFLKQFTIFFSTPTRQFILKYTKTL